MNSLSVLFDANGSTNFTTRQAHRNIFAELHLLRRTQHFP